ncbi:hypothetical protein [Sinorhizobium sp. NFACC03]|uniref:hypothetical protein n=1 Tax=Sinorhizobium sp. NFACC03 TaxID=1566295 RepID=UPI00088E0136|nr:hypothetical protein [Sinorhizobium sp. NFACC03]SDA87350.1 hypothetical protein SAMN03159448_03938 [Sinorhizobium sp. NFACC03]
MVDSVRQTSTFDNDDDDGKHGRRSSTILPEHPFLLLYWSAIINGMLAGPLIAIMTMMAANRHVMAQLKAPWWMLTRGGATALVMLAATAGMFLL